jgi:hypothetical protein
MSQVVSKMAIVASVVLALVACGTASAAQDFRSPDAHSAAVQDLRSPDAKTTFVQAPVRAPVVVTQDRRSPDGRDGARIFTQPPAPSPRASSSPDWVYLAIGGLVTLLIAGVALMTQRRRRHPLPLGS